MEVQMKAICEGRSTRNDVVQQNLEQYRAVFVRTQQQINVLKDVGGAHRHWTLEGPLM
jgi:DNA topoisomerase-3